MVKTDIRLIDEILGIGDYMRLRAVSAGCGRGGSDQRYNWRNGSVWRGCNRHGPRNRRWRTIFQVVDIAVDPAFQNRGLGKAIMARLMDRLAARLPARAHVSLIADGEAHRLYSQFGFQSVAPESQGMACWLDPKPV